MKDEYRRQIIWMLDELDEEMLRKIFTYTKIKLECQKSRITVAKKTGADD